MRASPLLMFAVLAAAACNGPPTIAPIDPGIGEGLEGDLSTPTKIDRVVQVTKPEVDVLWVVDNSCSMIEEQQALADAFPKFLDFFLNSNLDWHIGLVSTDTENQDENGKLIGTGGYRYIDDKTQNPALVFSQMTHLGTGGSATERGLLAAYRALAQPRSEIRQRNQGFLRPEAALHVIVISDEEDQSAPEMKRNEFVTYLQEMKDDEEIPVTFSAIVGPLPAGCNSTHGNAVAGSVYLAVANATGGLHESICEDDWVPLLENLGLHAAGLRREYFLSEAPVPGSLEVWVVDGDEQHDGVEFALDEETSGPEIKRRCDASGGYGCFPYFYDPTRNSIIIEREFVPAELAEIYIKYELLSGLQPEDDDVLDGGEE